MQTLTLPAKQVKKSQPAPRVDSSAAGELKQLIVDFMDACYEKKITLPVEVTELFPTLDDALRNGDNWYIQLVQAMFVQAVEEYVLGPKSRRDAEKDEE